MTHDIDTSRRRFLGTAAMTVAAVHLGALGVAEGTSGEQRELAALGRAAEWLNSPPLTPSSLAGKVVLVGFPRTRASTGCAPCPTSARGQRTTGRASL